jgi:hypothetical protein
VFFPHETWGLWLGLALSLQQPDKPAEPEVLPPPRPVMPLVHTLELHHGPDPYWRMRLYAPDRYGYLRPRVLYTPEGAYYPLTGEPYPHTPTKGIP